LKKSAFKAVFNKDPETAEEWQKAWHLAADEKVKKAQQRLTDIIEIMGPGVKLPSIQGSAQGGSSAAPAAAKPASSAPGRIQVNSQAEYDKLPVGALYVDSNGKPGEKRAKPGPLVTATASSDPSQYPKAAFPSPRSSLAH
jgi:hypothetical protein